MHYPEVAKYFQPKTRYESLTIFPDDKPEDQYSTISDTYTFDSIGIGDSRPMDLGTFKVSDKDRTELSLGRGI